MPLGRLSPVSLDINASAWPELNPGAGPLLICFDAVNVRIELRNVHRKSGEQAAKTGCLVAFANETLGRLIEGVVAQIRAVLDKKFEPANRTQPHYGRRRYCQDKRVLDG